MELRNKYLTFNEYRILDGNIPEMSFKRLEYKAEKIVDSKTFNRFGKINEYPNELKMCIYELIESLNSNEKNTSNIVSESDGDYSVTFANITKLDYEKELTGIIKEWLSETKVNNIPVLYCGADLNENRYNTIS